MTFKLIDTTERYYGHNGRVEGFIGSRINIQARREHLSVKHSHRMTPLHCQSYLLLLNNNRYFIRMSPSEITSIHPSFNPHTNPTPSFFNPEHFERVHILRNNLKCTPVLLSRISLQLSTSPTVEKRDRTSSWDMDCGR